MNSNEILEFASKTTFTRWRNDPVQSINADKNVVYAIEKAICENDYRGFTSNNGARGYAMSLGIDAICYALLYNMIQLSEYRRMKNGETLGIYDSDIIVTVQACVNKDVYSLEEQLQKGVREILDEIELLSNYPNLSQKEVNEQKRKLAEGRRSNSPSTQRAYEFADNVINAYTDYNIHYGLVTSSNPVQTSYEQMAIKGLNEYYTTKNVQK